MTEIEPSIAWLSVKRANHYKTWPPNQLALPTKVFQLICKVLLTAETSDFELHTYFFIFLTDLNSLQLSHFYTKRHHTCFPRFGCKLINVRIKINYVMISS